METSNTHLKVGVYRSASGAIYPDDAFENDAGPYDGPRRMQLDDFLEELSERIDRVKKAIAEEPR